jgi:hypothetical protein
MVSAPDNVKLSRPLCKRHHSLTRNFGLHDSQESCVLMRVQRKSFIHKQRTLIWACAVLGSTRARLGLFG